MVMATAVNADSPRRGAYSSRNPDGAAARIGARPAKAAHERAQGPKVPAPTQRKPPRAPRDGDAHLTDNGGLPQAIATDLLSALSVDQVSDAMAIRLDGPRTAADGFTTVIDWHITDVDTHHRVTVRNGVVVQRKVPAPLDGADAGYALTKEELLPVLAGFATADPVEGDGTALADLQAHLDRVDPDFPIVTP